MKRILMLSLLAVGAAAQAQVLVNTGFETNSLGNLNTQASGGPNPWISDANGAVVNTGPTLGAQAFTYSLTGQASGGGLYHSWVDLYTAPATGAAMNVGDSIIGTVSVFVDSQDANSLAGFGAWANSGTNLHGILAVGSGSRIIYRNGTGTVAATLTTNASVVDGWNTLEMRTTRTAVDTLVSTYKVNGTSLAGISHTRTVTPTNIVSDFDLALFNGGPAAANTVGRYDNYRVEIVPVPEPASMAALGLGALALVRRRRASK
jgi:hypothetical protein